MQLVRGIMIEFMSVGSFVAMSLYLYKNQKKLMPHAYFYFGQLIDGVDDNISWLGVLFRASVPLVMGFFTTLLIAMLTHTEPIAMYGLIVGLISAFLVVWPDIYRPELIAPAYQKQKNRLYLLHVIFVLLFSFLGSIGAYLVSIFYIMIPELRSLVDVKDIVKGLINDCLKGGILLAVAWFWKQRITKNRQNI